MKKTLLALLLTAAVLPALAGAQTPAAESKPPALRKEVVRLSFVDADSAMRLLMSFRGPGGSINFAKDANRNNMIVINDSPENVEKMLSLLKDIDVKPADLQFTLQLIQAGDAAEDRDDESLRNDPVLRQLRGVLRYKKFAQLDGTVVRATHGENAEIVLGRNSEFAITLRPKFVRDGKSESVLTVVHLQKATWVSGGAALAPQKTMTTLVGTTLALKPGEKTVVGVSKSGDDKGLILVLSVDVVK